MSEQLSRTRLFTAARRLFAENGYENTSTSSIARDAGTSESQLIKHFGGKAGVLEAIFVDGWATLRPWFDARLQPIASPVDRLRAIPHLMIESLGEDPDLRLLLLLEGRRIRKEGGHSALMDGFRGLVELIDETVGQIARTGHLRHNVSPEAVRAALLGLTEGAMRDRLLEERAGHTPKFTSKQIEVLTDALVDAVYVPATNGAGGYDS